MNCSKIPNYPLEGVGLCLEKMEEIREHEPGWYKCAKEGKDIYFDGDVNIYCD